MATDVTRLLAECRKGDRGAFDELVPLVYEDLRRIARAHLSKERLDHSLTSQALVHESYLNLAKGDGAEWRNRAHFFAVASRAMRHILIDHARGKKAQKRGGDAVDVSLNENTPGGKRPNAEQLIAIDDALNRLEKHDPRLARVVECRFFAGMTVRETAEALDSSVRTVERDWTRAKAYLTRELEP